MYSLPKYGFNGTLGKSFLLLIGLFFLSLGSVQAQESPKEQLLRKAEQSGDVRVIVRVKAHTQPEGILNSPQQISEQRDGIRRQQDRVYNRARIHKPTALKKFKYLPYMSMSVNRSGLDALYDDPDVIDVYEDKLAVASLNSSTPVIGVPGTIAQGFTGNGQVVAVLDTGVNRNHPFLSGKVVHEACFSSTVFSQDATTLCPNGSNQQIGTGAAEPCTALCDHGTHVAGIVAGNDSGLAGVARDAQIMAIQVFSQFNSNNACEPFSPPCVLSFTSDQIAALEHVYEQRNNFNIAAVNMSLGGGRFFSACDSVPTKNAIDLLHSVNIATVIASGNESFTDSITSPACISSAISVGATNDFDSVAGFSNSAQILDLLAPGVSINSSISSSSFASWNGTSMATPHVAGAFAVLRSKEPTASIDTILNSLKLTGVRVVDSRNGIEKPRIQIDQALAAIGGSIDTGNLSVSPGEGLVSSGPVTGPYSPASKSYTLSNIGAEQIQYTLSENVAWLNVSSTTGVLAPNSSTTITISIDPQANNLAVGDFNTSVTFNNDTNGIGNTSRSAILTVIQDYIANDKFIDSISLLQSSGSTTASNINATKEPGEPNHAFNTGGSSLWWRWTAQSSGGVTFDTIGSNFDTIIGVYTGASVDSLTTITSNDDTVGLQSQVTFTVQSGTTYFIAVDGYSGASGQIILNWDFIPDIVAPLPLVVTPDTPFIASGNQGGPYSPASITYTLTNFNTVAQAFQLQGLPAWLNASQTSGTLGASESTDVSLTIDASSADSLLAGTYSGELLFNSISRLYQLSVTDPNLSNDNFSEALSISTTPPATLSGNNLGATKETGEPNHGGNSGGSSVWWKWVAPASSTFTINTSGSDYDTTLGVYTGSSVNNLTTIASNDDSGSLQSRVDIEAVVATTYYISVDGYNGATGSISLNLNENDGIPPINDDFINASVLEGIPTTATGSNENATIDSGETDNGGRSIWWVWSSPVSQDVIIDTFGSNFDTTLAVYTGSNVVNLTSVAFNDDALSGGTLQSELSIPAQSGTTYYIAVDGLFGATGDVNLNLSTVGSINFNLQVDVIGSGTISSNVAGISCPGDCSESYSSETSLSLNATPGSGWSFAGWSGNCVGTGVCDFVMSQNRNVTAQFSRNPMLTVSIEGNGSVTSSPGGINCSPDCAQTYNTGTTVTLTAIPEQGLIFLGWTGSCSGTDTCSINLISDTTVNATFETAGATVLLVDDDDNTPDVQSFYRNALQSLGVDFTVWDTNNTDNEPNASILSTFPTVIWFSGHEFGGFAGPGSDGESALSTYLDSGGCLAMSSQDYSFDKGLTNFMAEYLGVAVVTNDKSSSIASGSGPFSGLGTFTLDYPFTDFTDLVVPDNSAQTAFNGSFGSIAIAKQTTSYRTTFWGFPFEAIPTAIKRSNGMQSLLHYCDPLSPEADPTVVLVSAVLPSSRSVTVGTTATAFATIINAGSSDALGCRLTPITSVAADFFFQTTDPATNTLTGTRDVSVDIAPGAAQTFVFGFTPNSAFGSTDVQLQYRCANANAAGVVTGLNTLLLSASDTPIPDIIALAATVSNDGIVHIHGATGTGFFSMASVNVGASDTLMVSVDTAGATLPIVISICETDPATAACINPSDPTTGEVTLTIGANATPTFSVFVQGLQDIAPDPANKRVFVRFRDTGGVTRGSTSVAVQTD